MNVLRLGSRSYPICHIVCPPYDDDEDPAEDRTLGGGSKLSIDYLIPSENGAVFWIEYQFSDHRWFLTIYSPVCSLHSQPLEPMWLPTSLSVDTRTRTLRPYTLPQRLPWSWPGADPEWLAESIDRWGKWPVVGLGDGPRAELVPA